MFRDHMARGTTLGLRAKELIDHGTLVPDDLTNALVAERLTQPDAGGGFVLDGYPRNLTQAEFLTKLYPEVRAINLELSDDEAVRRIAGRRTCGQCGAVFHLEFNPPQAAGLCDRCGGKLVERSDDTAEAVRKRLGDYHTLTEPLLEYYRARQALTTINGAPPIADVTAALVQAIG
jgi:adenylate kinase